MAPPPLSEVEKVSPSTIRDLFNGSQYPGLIANCALKKEFIRRKHLQNPSQRGEPPCTHSEIIHYISTDGELSVKIHQYLRPDGSLGASGKPDPKKLKLEGKIYTI